MPRSGDLEDSLWSERNFEPFDAALCEPTALAAGGTQTLASASPHLQIAIEDVLLGARVPTENPRRWDYDFEFEEPDEATWQCARLDIRLDDGKRVEVELLRPTAWLRENGFFSCEQVPIRIEELDIQGVGVIRSIDPCPPLATGEGSVVTARFITHGVQDVVELTLVDDLGSVETIEGTMGHPVWSVDRRQWIPLDELQRGERVSTQAGPATVLSATTTPRQTVVYNLEIHGEHVYQVGALGLLVHNTCPVQVPVTGAAQQSWPRISAVAPDWATKGAHIHVNGVELAVRPGAGGSVVLKSVFSSTNASTVKKASKAATEALRQIGFRQRLHNAAVRAIQNIPQESGKAAELRYLIAALQKLGV